MSKLGISIVGASMRSIFIFEYLKNNPHEGFIAGIYDTIPERGKYLLEVYGLKDAKIYDSLEQAVHDPASQGVFIGTPDYAHVGPVCAALAAGKHVYCEKPLAITLEDCDAIIDAAKNAQSVFYLGMNLRHSPVHDKMHEILTSGQLGKLLTIEANEYYFGGRSYFRRWNRLQKFGGGLWITKSCHDFDLLNWFAGGKPSRVFAMANLSFYKSKPEGGKYCRVCPIKSTCPDYFDVDNPKTERYWPKTFCDLAKITEEKTGHMQDLCLYNSDKDTFDNGMALVEYDNDIRATYTVNVVSARDTRQLRLMGTAGSAEGDLATSKVTVWKRYTNEKTEYDLSKLTGTSHGGADVKIMADFFECCRTGKKPRSSWADGRLGIQVALAARKSCETGDKVVL